VFLERLEREIEREDLLCKGMKVLVGVSGGPDSIALLHSLHRLSASWQWQVTAVHVNHQLRGEESEEDERFVRTVCAEWGITCETVRVDVGKAVAGQGGNLQAVARELRYEAFLKVARKQGADALALAHHADDQVETVLMRLIRGTGVSGLGGMEKKREWKGLWLVRPLLSFTREEILQYLMENGLRARFDSSNASPKYTRNRLRMEVIPLLKSFNPRFGEAVLQLADLVREEEHVWEQLVEEAMEGVAARRTDGGWTIEVYRFLHLPVALQRRMVKLILSYLANPAVPVATHDSVDRVRKLAASSDPSASLDLPGGIRAEREYSRLNLLKVTESCFAERSTDIVIPLKIPGITVLSGFLGSLEAVESETPLPYRPGKHVAVFDGDLVERPLVVRSRRPGDRMGCFGMNGSKKLKDLFMEAKIPRKLRDRFPVVVAGDRILWVPGVRRSDLAPVTKDTRRFLYLLWRGGDSFAPSRSGTET
jgi:tRNA(Ile)-lysidine synthase